MLARTFMGYLQGALGILTVLGMSFAAIAALVLHYQGQVAEAIFFLGIAIFVQGSSQITINTAG